MILGIGSDIIDIRRIEKALAQFGDRFEKRVFTEQERRRALSKTKAGATIVAASYAKRFAAKEACAKALGTGLGNGIFWRDMEVVNREDGAPTLHLTGGALLRMQSLTPERMQPFIHISLSDDFPYAQAQVIISAEAT